MLRAKVLNFFQSKKLRPQVERLAALLYVVGLVWILIFPNLAGNVFTSENALQGDRLHPHFHQSSVPPNNFQRIRQSLQPFASLKDSEKVKKYKAALVEELGNDMELVVQEKYVYGYLRSPRGYGLECNILTFPLNYEASITLATTFVKTWLHE